MDTLLVFFFTALALFIVLVVLLAWGLVRAARQATRKARRARIRLADSLPATTFGNRIWWQATRIDRVYEKAEYSIRCTSGSAFTDDVLALATQIQVGADQLRRRLRQLTTLSGAERARELTRVEPQISELEAGATALVSLTNRVLEHAHPDRALTPGETVRRRAEAMNQAIDELLAIESENFAPPELLVDSGDADTGSRLVPGIQSDQQRRKSLDRHGIAEPPGVDRT